VRQGFERERAGVHLGTLSSSFGGSVSGLVALAGGVARRIMGIARGTVPQAGRLVTERGMSKLIHSVISRRN
jgi:hypothetical protein